ncbi:MAG: GNAT family N-acetyltransferase [Elusimicrobia bacterium]|nr:GNAT family N-acetyltransferase [Elusimicrobiota bacterium]
MKVRVIEARDLPPEHRARWSEIQAAQPAFRSPYFSPEFTALVASVRDDVRVAVLEEDGAPVGYFPYQLGPGGIGSPVGGGMSDYQGVIAPSGFAWTAEDLVRQCGMVAWDFHHLLASQAAFVPYHRKVSPSPFMDLSAGFEAYAAARRTAGSDMIPDLRRKARKLEREVGPLRFEADMRDGTVLSTLLRWKSEQYARTRRNDAFRHRWAREIVERAHGTRTPRFAGVLSALYAGDTLVAAHFGMRSAEVWHYWFPAYDANFGKYSPGLILLLRMAESAAGLGLRYVDLGKGDDAYKEIMASGVVDVATGSVQGPVRAFFRFFPRVVSGGWYRLRRLV